MLFHIEIIVGEKSVTRLNVNDLENCSVLENFPFDPQSIQTFVLNGGIYVNGYEDAVLSVKIID